MTHMTWHRTDGMVWLSMSFTHTTHNQSITHTFSHTQTLTCIQTHSHTHTHTRTNTKTMHTYQVCTTSTFHSLYGCIERTCILVTPIQSWYQALKNTCQVLPPLSWFLSGEKVHVGSECVSRKVRKLVSDWGSKRIKVTVIGSYVASHFITQM